MPTQATQSDDVQHDDIIYSGGRVTIVSERETAVKYITEVIRDATSFVPKIEDPNWGDEAEIVVTYGVAVPVSVLETAQNDPNLPITGIVPYRDGMSDEVDITVTFTGVIDDE